MNSGSRDPWTYVVTMSSSTVPGPASTLHPRPVVEVMTSYVEWLKALPWPRTFAAFPLALDGVWVDYYLRRFTRYGVRQGHHEEDAVFAGGGLCLKSYAAAVTGMPAG